MPKALHLTQGQVKQREECFNLSKRNKRVINSLIIELKMYERFIFRQIAQSVAIDQTEEWKKRFSMAVQIIRTLRERPAKQVPERQGLCKRRKEEEKKNTIVRPSNVESFNCLHQCSRSTRRIALALSGEDDGLTRFPLHEPSELQRCTSSRSLLIHPLRLLRQPARRLSQRCSTRSAIQEKDRREKSSNFRI